jgi:acetoin utilization deacetylase AcuC-like enzyme
LRVQDEEGQAAEMIGMEVGDENRLDVVAVDSDVLLAAAREAGHAIVEVDGSERDAIRAVHDDGYLHYLEHAWRMWRELPGASAEVVPNVHPGRRMHSRPESVVGLAGYYQADGACPIGEGTWAGALASAQVAVHAVRDVMSGHVRAAYALCRPPGHHAYADLAGGLDASIDDPLAFLAVIGDGFRRIGAALAALGLPTVLVQEGGYLSPQLGANLQATLGGFEEER